MGLLRLILQASSYESDDDPSSVRPNGTNRGTVHGSHNKAALNRLGGRAMGRDAKPDGFLHKDSGRPSGRSGGRP